MGSLAQTCQFFVCLVWPVSAALDWATNKAESFTNDIKPLSDLHIIKASQNAFWDIYYIFERIYKKEELNIKVLNLLRKFVLVEDFYKIYPCKYYVK